MCQKALLLMTNVNQAFAPLAARMRPTTIEEYSGQSHLLGPDKPLRKMLYGFIERHDLSDSPYRALIGVGLLGAFTTFSTFSIETLTLLENGLWLKAVANVFLNVGACLLAGWLAIEFMKG